MIRLNIAVISLALLIVGCSTTGPGGVGVKNGRFKNCGKRKNCISSQTSISVNYIEPLPYIKSREQSLARMIAVINSMDRMKIIKTLPRYIHVIYSSKLNFKDDVEFYLDDKEEVIHMRSASRIGYFDFGSNKERLEHIRKQYLRALRLYNRREHG